MSELSIELSRRRVMLNNLDRIDKMTIWGQNITVLRVSRGMSLRELADRAGISHNTIVRMTYGHGESSIEKLSYLAQALDVSPFELLLEPEDLMELQELRAEKIVTF